MTPGFAALSAAFLLLAALALASPWGGRRAGLFCAGVSAAGGLAALAGLLALFAEPAFWRAGPALALALDPLSGWFLVAVGLVVAVAAPALAAEERGAGAARLLPLPVFVAAMLLALAAADGLTLLAGFEGMSLAAAALILARRDSAETRRAVSLLLGVSVAGGVALAVSVGLLAGAAGGTGFDAIRTAPPEGWAAAAVLALVLAGAGSKAGVLPFHAWLPLVHPAAPAPVSAMMSGAMVTVALSVAARFLLDLSGPAQPLWWGAAALGLGAATAAFGALRAVLAEDIKALLACSTIENAGMVLAALGLAACFRAADLPALAGLALAAALLHAAHHALFKALLFLAAGAVLAEGGSRRLDRLGGLVHAMPATAGLALVGAASAASVPLSAGFASEWLLLQALLAGPRIGEVWLQVALAVSLAAVGLAAALAAAAMLRFWGLVFLGRPRAPRVLGAREAGMLWRGPMAAAAGLLLLAGLAPGVAAGGAGAVGAWLGVGAAAGAGFGVGGGSGVAGAMLGLAAPGAAYLPLPVAAVLAALGAALWWLFRRVGRPEPVRGPAWGCGAAPPPRWLPLGDPLTQPSAAGFAQPLRRMLAEPWFARREGIVAPEPAAPGAARLGVSVGDPSVAWLLRPLGRARDWLAARAEAWRDWSLRRHLGLVLALVCALLLAFAAAG
jgi:formate hydrogenlyase subunit 3/multisubunit Na+/H+ antiporter MnhD subunit